MSEDLGADDNIVSATVVIEIEAILRKGTKIDTLIKKQTDILFEPRSANGCVVNHKITEIK